MFFIHYEDPGFPDPPWPGQRRSGAFLTLVEAKSQAISEAASGYAQPLGIFDEAGSEALKNHMGSGEADTDEESFAKFPGMPHFSSKDIMDNAAKLREDELSKQIAERQADVDALQSILPIGVNADDVITLKGDA